MGYEENEARSYGLRALYGLCLFSQLNKLPPKGQVFVAKQIQMEKETTVNKTFENRKEVQTILPIEKKYTQDWHKYNLAKCNEKLLFYELLNDLSKLIREKPYRFGRPFIPIKDLFFSVGLKLYSNYSGRKTMSDLKKANDAGYISVKPHFNTLTEFLNCPATYELLSKMLTVSAIPLNKLEDKFSIDSSGFGSYQYERWMRVRFQKDPTGKMSKRGWRNYLKGHILIGTRTNVICSAEITEGNLADVKQLPKLLEKAKGFNIKEVSADKAYSSKMVFRIIQAIGAIPYIPFKYTTKQPTKDSPDIWNKMFLLFRDKQEEWKEHYHKRSNVESTFAMVKLRFGEFLRCKSFEAQRNELLMKFICHNICCLIQEMYEHNVQIDFKDSLKIYVDQKVLATKFEELETYD